MSFLTAEELKTIAPSEFVAIVAGIEPNLIEEIINEMISLMKTNLGTYYDAEEIFNKTGDDRNLTVLLYLKDLVWYKWQRKRS
jgi:hypothetical protein